MNKYINIDTSPLKDIDSYSNYEQDLSIDYYDPSFFSSKISGEFNENVDEIEKRIYYKEQKDVAQNTSKDEQNKNKNDIFPVNINEKNKNDEINNIKKTEETLATSEKNEQKLNKENKNENNNNSNKNISKIIEEIKNIDLNYEKNNNNINRKGKVSNKKFINKKRTKKISTNGNNNNLKKVRLMILNSIIRFINKKIKKVFNNNIGKGIVEKQFVNISKDELTHSSVEFDKNYLKKNLKEIFSGHISGKYTNYLKNKNEELLHELINLEDNGDYFNSLFELTFLDCIEHINGIKNISLLDDYESVDEIILNESDDADLDDVRNYKETIKHYKEYIENKNSRRPRKNN